MTIRAIRRSGPLPMADQVRGDEPLPVAARELTHDRVLRRSFLGGDSARTPPPHIVMRSEGVPLRLAERVSRPGRAIPRRRSTARAFGPASGFDLTWVVVDLLGGPAAILRLGKAPMRANSARTGSKPTHASGDDPRRAVLPCQTTNPS